MRVSKTKRRARKKLFLVTMGLVAAVSILLISILHFDEIAVPVRQTYEGIVELNPTSSLNISSSDITVSGTYDPFSFAQGGNSFRWEEDGLSRIQLLHFSQDEPGRTIRVQDSNETLAQLNATDLRMDHQSIMNCSRLYLRNSDFEASVAHHYARLRIEGVSRGAQSLPLTFDALRGKEFMTMDVVALETVDDGYASLTCEYPRLIIDGQNLEYNGTIYLVLEHFGSIGAQIILGEDSGIEVYGDLNIASANARVDGYDVSGHLATYSTDYEIPSRFVVIDSAEVIVDIENEELEYRFPVEPVRMHLKAEGSALFTDQSGQLQPTSTFTKRVYLLGLGTAWRQAFSILLLLCLAVLIFSLVSDAKDSLLERFSHPRKGGGEIPRLMRLKNAVRFWRSPNFNWKKIVSKSIVAIVVVSLLGYLAFYSVVWATMGNKPMPYHYHEYEVEVIAWYEEGVHFEPIRIAVEMFASQMKRILDVQAVSITWREFPDDHMEYYDKKDSRTYEPVGRKGYDTVGIVMSHRVEYNVIFKKGIGKGFVGVNVYGPVTVIPVVDVWDPVALLDTLMHEFGHALMLRHNPCSPLMTNESDHQDPTLPYEMSISPGYLFRGVPLFDLARNGTITGFDDWGTEVGRLLNRTIELEALNRTMTRNVYVFYNESKNEIHEVVYWRSEDRPSGEISEATWIQRVPSDAYAHSFSVGEYIYLLESIAGWHRPEEAMKYFC